MNNPNHVRRLYVVADTEDEFRQVCDRLEVDHRTAVYVLPCSPEPFWATNGETAWLVVLDGAGRLHKYPRIDDMLAHAERQGIRVTNVNMQTAEEA